MEKSEGKRSLGRRTRKWDDVDDDVEQKLKVKQLQQKTKCYTNKISCYKNIVYRNRQQMQTVSTI
jgi:uncharacterized protein YlxW (UPF0749 family)